MGLGISKWFLIFLAISIFVAIGMENWRYGAVIMICYSILRIIWRFLTEE